MHRSRVCHFVIDVSDLDQGVAFWSAALDAAEEPVSEQSRHVYRKFRLPDSNIRILLQATSDKKVAKERMHLDLETDNVEAEVQRLEALGAKRWGLQDERGFKFWVLRDPWDNEFCVLQPEFPELLAKREPWPDRETRQPIEVRLRIDEAGIAVRVYDRNDQLVDEYHADLRSMTEAQQEITDRYVRLGYEAEGKWRPQQWTTGADGYGEIIHESSRKFS
jgi:predicted enzyme related to lactoylglutathione lyase